MAGIAIVLLSFAAAFTIGLARQRVAERAVASAPTMKRWGGVMLIVVGTFFVATGVFVDAFARLFPV